ncbi:unnamed protein product [Rotaria sp. Silwood2]|nr:unnamed protein product [Rotaria sp. Silwood2]CAF3975301.1 unnamed protein product [Rotaria sp. Silwood2]
MTSLPTDRIFDLRNEIHKNVSQVHANKMQCERLCERIDQLIDPLERLEHATLSTLREETRPILDKLLRCIDDCNNYIEKLKSSEQWYEEIYEYKQSDEKFKELNNRLSQIGQDLCLGLNIQELFDRKQDQEDRQKDLKDLHKKLDEISQKMLEKQCEQHKLIDKMIDKRFQSFRFSLAQNLLIQQESKQSQEILEKRQQFLHIPYKDLYIEDKLVGSGGFADVYKAQWLTHHDLVAVKIIRINYLSNIEKDFYREISTMYRIHYENVLNVFGACIEPNLYAIIVEYMPLGSLYDILHKKSEQISFDWFDRYSIAWQMTKSINYLHNLDPSILHRDIKSMNFLLKYNGSSNQKYIVKVCDFGLAEIRRETLLQSASLTSFQIIGSFCWKAPELFKPPGTHTKKTDIYSLGIVFWELATARKPWDEYEDEAVILVQVKTGERPTIPSDIPEPYKQGIQDAWNHDSQKRPTCFQLMQRFYKEINQLIIVNNEKDIIDLQRQQTTTEQINDSVNSTTNTDSTVTAIQVAEEENEEKKSKNSQQTIIVSESLHDETKIEEKTNVEEKETVHNEPQSMLQHSTSSNITEEQHQASSSLIHQTESEAILEQSSSSNITGELNQTTSFSISQIESESMLQHNSSSNINEEQNQTTSSPISQIEEKLLKSTENLTPNIPADNHTEYPSYQTLFPIDKIKPRRPLHGLLSRWPQKKN